MQLIWYFDFISPFAYLQFQRFNELPDNVEITYKPILLAGLLNHWKNVGPAEIPPKRTFTYQHCYWYAKKNKIPFKMPPAHPFNPLAALRLAIVTNCQHDCIKIIFDLIWKEGIALNSKEAINYLEKSLAITNLQSIISTQTIKDKLFQNTQDAANALVFGVPTFIVENNTDNLFWGLDTFDMLLDYLKSPEIFDNDELDRITKLPQEVQRKY